MWLLLSVYLCAYAGCWHWTSNSSFPTSDCAASVSATWPSWSIRRGFALCYTDPEGID